MHANPRQQIGEALTGDVLEIGPGSNPFPAGPAAKVIYADRSVEGGRDSNWPELIGHPVGIDADFDINLDVDALSPFADESFDAVVASHVIEHLANPIRAIVEFERVLRPGGKLVLIVPDRTLTFDSVRVPTELSHLLQEFRNGVTDVDEAHIIEFCEAIYRQPPIHPAIVREWHNPARIDDALVALHRRRSIHVHCWSPEEFASLIAGSLAHGLMSWKLCSVYFEENNPGGGEFGVVLERVPHDTPESLCRQFVQDWVACLFAGPSSDVRRVALFQRVICRDLGRMEHFNEVISLPSFVLAEKLAAATSELNNIANSVAEKARIVDAMTKSTSWRITAPLRKVVTAVRGLR
jgi:SAM-dependent methyltransferase